MAMSRLDCTTHTQTTTLSLLSKYIYIVLIGRPTYCATNWPWTVWIMAVIIGAEFP